MEWMTKREKNAVCSLSFICYGLWGKVERTVKNVSERVNRCTIFSECEGKFLSTPFGPSNDCGRNLIPFSTEFVNLGWGFSEYVNPPWIELYIGVWIIRTTRETSSLCRACSVGCGIPAAVSVKMKCCLIWRMFTDVSQPWTWRQFIPPKPP